MMRAGYIALHYGQEYLPWAVKSLCDAGLDEVHVFYTVQPSFGFTQGTVCPDVEPVLHSAALRYVKKGQLHWHAGRWSGETQHRSHAIDVLRKRGATIAAVADADEIWDPDTLRACLDFVEKEGDVGRGRFAWSASFFNFWRSWRWRVRDHFRSIRVLDFRSAALNNPPHPALPAEVQTHPIYHFGYAQSEAIMRYKWTCHGHQRELKEGWMDRFINWELPDTDLHPCVNDLWERAYPVDLPTKHFLDRLLPDHPHRDMEIIR